ncbi:MAG: hypothetical protein ACKOC5_08800 [Chloroflexota bacterium]
MITIDGAIYNVPVTRLSRRAEFLDKYAERTEDGVLHRELIGVYFNYQLQFGNDGDTAEYARLWAKLTEPVEFHMVTVPDEDGDYSFQAYFSNVGDELVKARGATRFWRSLTVNFVAQSPARV